MSKAPGALEDYEGDGEWFKVMASVASDGQYWDSYGKHSVSHFFLSLNTIPLS